MAHYNIKLLRLIALAALALSALSPEEAKAIDPVCELIIKASEARADATTWQSTTEVNSSFKTEALKINGQFFRRSNGGKWTISSTNFDEAERQLAKEIRDGVVKISECKQHGSETVSGIETSVVTYRIEMSGAPAAEAKLSIGKADGLPYAQTSASIKSTYSYQGVVEPKL